MDYGFFFKTSLLAIVIFSYVYVGFERHDNSLSLPRWRRQLRQRSLKFLWSLSNCQHAFIKKNTFTFSLTYTHSWWCFKITIKAKRISAWFKRSLMRMHIVECHRKLGSGLLKTFSALGRSEFSLIEVSFPVWYKI